MPSSENLWSKAWSFLADPPPPILVYLSDQPDKCISLRCPQRHWDLYYKRDCLLELAPFTIPGDILTEGGVRVGCLSHIAPPGTYQFRVCSGRTSKHAITARSLHPGQVMFASHCGQIAQTLVSDCITVETHK